MPSFQYYRAVQRLKEISVNAKKLRLFDLGYMEGLLYVAHKLELLELLGRQNGNTLKQLNIATIKENLDSQLFIRINPEIFYSMKTLTSLSLDYDYFNDDILHMFCNSSRVPLLKLHLIVQNIDISHRGTSNNSWTRFVLSKYVSLPQSCFSVQSSTLFNFHISAALTASYT